MTTARLRRIMLFPPASLIVLAALAATVAIPPSAIAAPGAGPEITRLDAPALRTLRTIESSTRLEVDLLAARAAALPPGTERAALERRIVALKLEGERMLEAARAAAGQAPAPARDAATLDLSALDTPPGWATPLVPRGDATATSGSATAGSTLPGNTASTYLSLATHVTGTGYAPVVTSQATVDDSLLASTALDASAPIYLLDVNSGPFTLRGGRHTLAHVVDPANVVAETDETDNVYSSQWIWTPLITSERVPNLRAMPPTKGFGLYPNADGFAYTHTAGTAWVVSEAARLNGDDDDLYVYDDYTDATTGFTHRIGYSNLGGNNTDFVVGHRTGTPTTLYPAVTFYSAVGGGGPFAIDQSDAHDRSGDLTQTATFSWLGTLPANRLADVYEAYMNVGVTYYFALRTTVGATPCWFEIFPATDGGIYGRGGGNTSYSQGFDQVLSYIPTSTGWHPVVVYRLNGSGAANVSAYDFEWGGSGFVGVSDPHVPELSFAGVAPDPMGARGRFAFTLPAAGRVTLELYDITGRRIHTLADGSYPAGQHRVEWDGRGGDGRRVTAGLYWARLETGGRALTRRVVILP